MREDRVLLFMYCGTLVLYPTGVLMVVNVTWVFFAIQKLYLLRIQYRFLSLITIIVPAGWWVCGYQQDKLLLTEQVDRKYEKEWRNEIQFLKSPCSNQFTFEDNEISIFRYWADQRIVLRFKIYKYWKSVSRSDLCPGVFLIIKSRVRRNHSHKCTNSIFH